MLHLSSSSPCMRTASFTGGPSTLFPSATTSSSSSRGPAAGRPLGADAPAASGYHHRRAPGRRGLVHVQASSQDAGGQPLGSSREAAERRRAGVALLKYVREVQPALIDSFVACGPPAVVAAMKSTITNMLGTLPPQFFTVTISTVGENLSQLMLSVMMTGYLFKSTQNRLDLHRALGGGAGTSSSSMRGTAARTSPQQQQQPAPVASSMARSLSAPLQGSVFDDAAYAPGAQKSSVQGDVLVWHKENGVERLEAVTYIELLEAEVTRLRSTLEATTQQQQQLAGQGTPGQQLLPPGSPQQQWQQQQPGDARPLPVSLSSAGQGTSLQQQSVGAAAAAAHAGGPAGVLALHEDGGCNALLDYLRALDPASLTELTGSAGSEVAAAMEAFVARLMGGSDRDSLARAGSDCTAQELAKVMLWLMIVGFELRALELGFEMALAD